MKCLNVFHVFWITLVMSVEWSHSVVIQVENLPERCDYSKCTALDQTKLNVHLVPHTHDDVGWLKTVDQYYYGTANEYQKVGVQYILDSIVQELIQNKDRRFIYVEMAFFWMWWSEQNELQRAIVKELVRTGQLEFINGGWSMNDEAVCHYQSIIDQMSLGHRRLHETFGRCAVPKVAWQIDPFGHSREQANLFAGMNFDALFFAREDYQDLQHRRSTKTFEHVWQGSDDLGSAGDLFTGMMDGNPGYVMPRNFNWDLVSMGDSDEPVVDNVNSEEYNVPRMVDKFVTMAKEYAKGYATANIMIPMGMDFHYQDAHVYFKNMDKLISAVNQRSTEVKVVYSTPSCYAKALHSSNRNWTSKADDYFPYASDPHQYWTGYYTSRPSLKRFERVANSVLQACKQIDALGHNADRFESQVNALREMMGVMQHHDAITGTEKQHVANNYAKHLSVAIDKCLQVIHTTTQERLVAKAGNTEAVPSTFKHDHCVQLNVSSCPVTESGNSFVVNIYNPLGRQVTGKQIRLPVDAAKFYSVTDAEGHTVVASLVDITDRVKRLTERQTKSTTELVFRVDLPPLGLTTYFVQANVTRGANSAAKVQSTKITKETSLKAKNFEVILDSTGQLSEVKLSNGKKVSLKSEFLSYNGGNSGAYRFTPSGKAETFGKLTGAEVFGAEVQEVFQQYDSSLSQTIRVDPTSDVIEFEWTVGPLTGSDTQEIIARFATDLKNNRTFYTDANGRQWMRRVLDYRPSWRIDVNEPISGNYYPVTTAIALRDQVAGLQLTVLTDRAQGGSSIGEGQLELMVHRRCQFDDNYGVAEPLREPGFDGQGLVVRGRHLVLIDSITASASRHRQLTQQLLLEPVVSFVTGVTEQQYRSHFATSFSGLSADALPANIHLLTLEQWSDAQVLVRLEHIYQVGEHSELSKPATVSLKLLFKAFTIKEAKEVTLSGNADISEVKNRLRFKYTPEGKVVEPAEAKFEVAKLEVTLNPMQIRTFLVKVSQN